MLSLERMRAAIDKSGYSTQAVFDRLSCGRGMVLRMDLATLARKLEPGATDEQINRLWYQTGKTRGGALSLVEFMSFFGDGPRITQLSGVFSDLLQPKYPLQAPFSPRAAWPPGTLMQDLPQSYPANFSPLMSPAGHMSMLDFSQSESAGVAMPNMNFWQSLAEQSTGTHPKNHSGIADATPQQTTSPQVASDWVECVEPQTGRRYFHSATEGRSSWTDPRTAQTTASLPTETLAHDWVEHVDPGTGRNFFFSAREGRSSWTDPRPTPSVERSVSDDRFKQLMDYFNQMVQSRGHTAAIWFEFADLDKDGLLQSAEFVKAIADLGVHGVEQQELQLLLKRIGGSGPGSAYVSVDSLVRAITDPTGFLVASSVSSIQSAPSIADSRCVQVLEYVNQVVLSRGYTAQMYLDYIDLNKDGYLTSAEFMKGLTDLGSNAVDPTELQQLFKRIEGSASDGAFVQVRSLVQAVTDPAGFISRLPSQSAAVVETRNLAIDDVRFIQLLDYCKQVLASQGQTALGYLSASDLDGDGRLTSLEFVKVLRDLGLREGVESTELRQVFQRVEGSGTASAHALVSSLAAAISDPVGFLAGNVHPMQPTAPAKIDDARFTQLLEYCRQVLLSRGQTALGHLNTVDLDRDGRLSSMEFIKVLRDVGLREGIESTELRQVFQRIEGSGTDAAHAPISSLAAAISDPAGFLASKAHAVQPAAPVAIDDARFTQLLEYCRQVLLSRGQTALGHLNTVDLDRDGRLSSMEFIKVLRDVGLREGIESTELRQVFQRIEGSGTDAAHAPISSLAAAISDPAGFLAGNARTMQPLAPQTSVPKQRRIIVQLRTSPLKKLGFGASRSSDGLALVVDRIDIVGLLADWNVLQKLSSDRVQISDHIAEVNGLSASPDDMIQALQSQGLLTIVFVRHEKAAIDAVSNVETGAQIIDDARFQQLLVYFNQVLLSRGFTAATYFEGVDLSKTGCLSIAGFIQSLTDLGISGIDQTELQKVFKRVEGSGLDSSQVFVSAVVDAISDPTGFMARCGRSKLFDTEASTPTRKRMTVQLRPSALKRLGFGADQSDDGLTLFVKRIDIVGLLADWNAEQKRSRDRVRVGDQIAEVNGQTGNPKTLAKALQSPGLLTIVFTRLDQEAAEAKKKATPDTIIDTPRFKQLLQYFNEVLLSRGYTAAPYFDAIDLNKDGYLSVSEFIKGWADLGVNGLDLAELKNVLQRIKGGGLESAQARVNDIVDAINDPAGFIARGGASVQSPAAQAAMCGSRRINVQLRPSGLKKLGLGCSLSDDGSQLLVKRIDVSGLLADWNAGQKRSSDRVRIGDRLAEVNGSANIGVMTKALQSQGLLMLVFARQDPVALRPDSSAADLTKKVDAGSIIDDDRFKQLLDYFNQILLSRGLAALTYFEAVDLDKDGRLSSADFIKGLTDLGVNGVEQAELQRVFQRIDGTGLDSTQVLVSSIADAITDPARFMIKAVTPTPSPAPAIRKRITATLLPSAFKKFGLGVSQDAVALLVSRIDNIGVLADWNAEQKRSSDRVRVGDLIEQVNGQNANQDSITYALQGQGPVTIVFARREKAADEKKKDELMDDSRLKELLEYFRQTLQLRGRTASTYFGSADLDKDGRLSVAEFIKALTDLGVQGVEIAELQKVLKRIKGSGSDTSAPVLVTSIIAAVTDPAGFVLKSSKASEPTPVQAGLSSSGRASIQLRPSFFKKLGLGVSPADDRISLLISRIDSNGLVAGWNAEQKLAPDRVQVGDQIIEVNGKSGNADELNRALQLQDLLTIVFVRRNQGPAVGKSKIEGKQIIDDMRFKQLLMHFNALLMKRGQTASKYFQSLDSNRDGRLSSTEFLKGLTDLGISGTDRLELQKVFRRIEGSGSDMAHVLVNSVVDAFTNPAGAIAKTANSAGRS